MSNILDFQVKGAAKVDCPSCGHPMRRQKHYRRWEGELNGTVTEIIEGFDCLNCQPRIRVVMSMKLQPVIWLGDKWWKIDEIAGEVKEDLKKKWGLNPGEIEDDF